MYGIIRKFNAILRNCLAIVQALHDFIKRFDAVSSKGRLSRNDALSQPAMIAESSREWRAG
jgi:hypothetical protein